MIKLLHAADFHLDSAFSSLPPELAAQRRKEQRLALQYFAAVCSDCDIVLLSGDLFDSTNIYRDTLDALKECFASIRTQIFISPGNHDFVAGGSPYLSENWGDNVHIFKHPTMERVHLEELNCDVYGAGFVSMEQEALLENFRVSDENALNLMVIHGDLQPNSSYHPIRTDEIAATGLDYLALGHVHSSMVATAGRTTYAYPGCLMGRGFDECGQKGVLKVCVDKRTCKVDFLPLKSRKYEILSIEVTDEPLVAVRAALPENCADDCYRLILTGESDGIDVSALEDSLRREFFSLEIRDRTLPKQELWSAVADDTLRGHFLRELKAQYDQADGQDKLTIARAAKLGLDLMDGREVQL